MKFKLKAALAVVLSALMALAAVPVSALPRFDAKAEITPSWTVPAGYNVHDYTKCVEFLEQTDENGVKNGDKLSDNYDPNDPGTWGTDLWGETSFIWNEEAEQKICEISVGGGNLTGSLDVSGCTALEILSCYENNLNELDVSACTALRDLYCSHNNFSELDLSNNPNLAYDTILADGDGLIGYFFENDWYEGALFAYPINDASFEGFYDENGALISEGEWSDSAEAYVFSFEGLNSGTIIARFSGGTALPGDLDDNGSVSVADAITTLRLAMQLSDGSGMNTDAADMDGNGNITLADAIVILRMAMGLA